MRNLLSRVAKSAQPAVATIVRSIFAQPDTETIRAQLHRVTAQLEAKFPRRRCSATLPRRSSPHRVSQGALAADLVQQPAGAAQQGAAPATDVVGIFPTARR